MALLVSAEPITPWERVTVNDGGKPRRRTQQAAIPFGTQTRWRVCTTHHRNPSKAMFSRISLVTHNPVYRMLAILACGFLIRSIGYAMPAGEGGSLIDHGTNYCWLNAGVGYNEHVRA